MGPIGMLSVGVERLAPYRILRGILMALFSFAAVGTITAVWRNPFFARMTPIEGWELPSLFALAGLAGVFMAIRQPACSTKKAGIGSVASFLGIACPTCNKILMLVFGGEVLMRWFDPIRPVVTIAGLILLSLAVFGEWRRRTQARPLRDQVQSHEASFHMGWPRGS
jgi:hypothetical protein